MAELVPLLFIAIAVIFLLVLPMRQRNRALQRAQQLQSSLAPGTEVMTTSGLFGTVVAIGDDTVDLEVSPGVTIRWAKAAIAEIKSAPATEPGTQPADRPAGGEPDAV
jgi:preprotein translocase subunit YajC